MLTNARGTLTASITMTIADQRQHTGKKAGHVFGQDEVDILDVVGQTAHQFAVRALIEEAQRSVCSLPKRSRRISRTVYCETRIMNRVCTQVTEA